MRYGTKDARVAFLRLLDLLGEREAESWHDVGGWSLDHNPTYGGFVVHEVVNTSGGVRCPLGDQRRTARGFCEVVWFAERCADMRAARLETTS